MLFKKTRRVKYGVLGDAQTITPENLVKKTKINGVIVYKNMADTIDDQRLYPRRLLFLSLSCSDFLRDVSHKVKSKNISRGGICITTQGNPFDVGSQVLLDFDLENEIIYIKGEVVWTNQITFDVYNNGIKFIKPKKKDIEKLLNFGVFSPIPRRLEH